MKALTLIQPWASAVLLCGKDVENRPWSPPQSMAGQRIAVHAGKKLDLDAMAGLMDELPDQDLPGGAFVGIVELVGWVSLPNGRRLLTAPGLSEDEVAGVVSSRWRARDTKCAWLLRNPVALSEPIPWPGALGLWDVPADVEAQIKASLRATEKETA